jgi:selenocysteine-specific elongation factor
VRSIVIGTAGHIDHGKSALVRALTGTDPDPSSRARLDRGIDRTREEQARGITIDIGFAHLTRAGGSYSFVDVPGHERFVRNMLAGAGGIDLVLLVVAADESVMPQTREHFEICRLLRIPAGVIALTKTDLADAETIELATLETRELVRGSFLAEAPIVPVSARTGRGLEALLDAIDAAAGAAPERAVDGPARLPIDRVFSVRGFGTVATGTLVSGAMAQDRTLVVLPGDRAVKVRGLQVHGRAEERVSAGQRVAVNLGGVDAHELARGHVLCDPEVYEAVRRLDAAIELLPAVAGPATADAAKPTLKHGMRIRLHCGTSEVLGRVAVAAHDAAPGPGPVHARIRLESPIVVTRGDRFILRSYSPVDTIGGGVVLDPMPPRGAIRTDAGRARFRRLDFDPSRSDADAGAGASDAAAIVFLDERARAGMSRAEMTRRAGLSPAAAERTAARLVSRGLAAAVGERIVSAGVIDALRGELLEALRVHHAEHPLSDGMPREEAREQVFRHAAAGLFELVVDRLASSGTIAGRDRLAIAGHRVSLTGDEARVSTALERIYREAGLTPPDAAAAAAAAGAPPAVAERVTSLLVRSRTLVRLDTLYFHAAALEALKADVRALKPASGSGAGAARVDVAAFKGRYGVTRKYAIPLLEYLDRERVTRRVGEARIVL